MRAIVLRSSEYYVVLRANIENLANEADRESPFGGYLTQRAPRTLNVAATINS